MTFMMKPTEQQDTCVVAAQTYPIVKIEAGAGSGKTSTLKLVSEAVLDPSLYVAFNKVTATEASEKFPKHVGCKTTHSIAYAKFGRGLQDKLSRPKGKYENVAFTGTEIARFYKLSNTFDQARDLVVTANAVGLFVRQAVERFEQSADAKLERKHLPLADMKKMMDADRNADSYVLDYARRLWADRINNDSIVLASHDTYLKLFQLSKPNLGYDVVYLDEAQDSTPCVLDIVMTQATHGAKIILVGDRYQAIYGWRGAINAMERIEGHTTLLSKSFRFGQGIADVATAVLQGKLALTGREDLVSIIGGAGTVDRTKPYMNLFRTNSALLYAAVSAISAGEEIRLEVDVKDFIRMLQSAQALSIGDMKNVKHENILPYPTWEEYKEEAKKITGEMKRIVTIIEGGDFNRFVRTLEHYENPVSAAIIYTTGHKAKGREHDQVVLCDDFPSHYDGGEWVGLTDMEQNLLYVAVTRSMRVLEINDSVREAMDYFKNNGAEDVPDAKERSQQQVKALIREIGNDNGMAMNGDMAIEAMHQEMGFEEGYGGRQ
jgi:superfamily I DNA/RNA helicase